MAKLNFLGGKFHGAENDSGAIVPGGKLYFYEPGTATLKDTYTTSNLDTENTNPVILDSAGRATIWLNGNYKVRFDDADDNTIYTEDNINPDQSTVSGNYNLVLNGTFEDDTNSDGTPDSWDSFTYTPGGSVTRVTNDQNHGAASMEFISTGSGGGYLTTTNFFEVSPNRDFEVTFLIQSSVVDVRNVVTVFWYKADQTASTTPSVDAYDDSTTNPTSWAERSNTIIPPSDARYAKLRLYGCHSSDATPGTTWYDNIIVRLGSAVGTLTTRGDMLTKDAAGLARLAVGTGYTILGSDGTDPSWGVIGLLGYSSGLGLSLDVDTDHDVLVAVGEATDSANASILKLLTGITKQIDAIWAVGDDAGGLFSGTVAADTVYHFFLIQKDSDGTIDAGFDTSVTAANIPTGYTAYSNIGYCWTDASSNILGLIGAKNNGKVNSLYAPIPTTSGTIREIPYIPPWVKRITLWGRDLSCTAGSEFMVQLGDSGGLETTGYDSIDVAIDNVLAISLVAVTTGLVMTNSNLIPAATPYTGKMTIELYDPANNTWLSHAIGHAWDGATRVTVNATGAKSLTGTLDKMRFTTVGANTFDLGSFNLSLEG